MHTIKLKISDNVYDKFMSLLDTYQKDEVVVIQEDEEFNKTKKSLEHELNEILEGKAKFHRLEEFDEALEV